MVFFLVKPNIWEFYLCMFLFCLVLVVESAKSIEIPKNHCGLWTPSVLLNWSPFSHCLQLVCHVVVTQT